MNNFQKESIWRISAIYVIIGDSTLKKTMLKVSTKINALVNRSNGEFSYLLKFALNSLKIVIAELQM